MQRVLAAAGSLCPPCPAAATRDAVRVLLGRSGHGFTRFDRTGDMLFSEVVAETACYDLTTGVLTKSGTDKITGGTGRFAGATG